MTIIAVLASLVVGLVIGMRMLTCACPACQRLWDCCAATTLVLAGAIVYCTIRGVK